MNKNTKDKYNKNNLKNNLKKMWIADQGDGTYTNPILYTDYSDPDVIRVGEDYFMVASSFCNAPSVPLLHSKDLVNWKVINYIMQELPFERYDRPVHGCGAWAPSIRFHEGVYYVFVPFPDEGIMMCKATDPWGEWSEPAFVRKVTGWIDPCPFWDDDGRAYMVTAFARSRIGFNSYLYMSPMEPDCSGVLGDGQFVFDGHDTQPIIEGPKLYKRNGYYYIFAPAGGVETGWQTVLRSRHIYGPYEERIVMRQGGSPVNGPHQGGWVDTPGGENWFIHFQDVGNAGRIIHLQPMRWENDWPVIGVKDTEGCGEPVMHYQKPDVGDSYPIDAPEDSDFFTGGKLGLQWQWNANPKASWYELKDGCLVLHAECVRYGQGESHRQAEKSLQLCDVPNLLLQKWPAPEFKITSCLHLEGMQDGDEAGLVSQCLHYTALTVGKKDGRFRLLQRIGNWEKNDEVQAELMLQEDSLFLEKIATEQKLYLRMQVKAEKEVSFAVSVDGDRFYPVGETEAATPGRWVGAKAGLFAIREDESVGGGTVSVEYFVFEAI